MPSFSSFPSFPSLSSLPSWPSLSSIKPYTLDVQQGVVIDPEMIGRLKEGMTRVQVGFVLGTPLLADPFHANRWDYVYYVRKKGIVDHPHNLTVFFKDGKLQRFETDYALPPPATAAAATATPPAGAKPAAPVLPPAAVPVPPIEPH
ncbi:MAG: outer membrane protein assembly factor BamE [Betaproteobacteria bacterium]|nr:outer membrane protein assembly factor BamE [Betaproteobacteria bacterium]